MWCKEKSWVDVVQFWEKEKTVHSSHYSTSGFPRRPETDDVYVTAKHVRRYTQPDVSDTESSEDEDDLLQGEDSDDDDDISTTGSTSRSWCIIS